MKASDSDEQLMRAVQQGEQDSAAALVRRYANGLLTFVTRMIGDHHTSEELVQEVFLSVWNNRAQYRYPMSFRSWLFTIAHNRCRQFFRKQRMPVVDADPVVPVETDGPSRLAVRSEEATHVERAVARLPEQQRMVVVLRIWNGMSYAEVAQVIGCSEATARSHMHHALIALRGWMEPVLGHKNEES